MNRLSKLATTGLLLIVVGLLLISSVLIPAIREEVKYTQYKKVRKTLTFEEIKPVDSQFGIVIPKINANAPIVPNIDPYEPSVYQQALTKGVAHAKGTSTPDKTGNMFLFAHSSSDYFWASRYNSVFYLISKLEVGDPIEIYHNGNKYTYLVHATKTVNADDVSYLYNTEYKNTLTLMTCWPAGTTLKRFIVEAELAS